MVGIFRIFAQHSSGMIQLRAGHNQRPTLRELSRYLLNGSCLELSFTLISL